MLCHDFDDADDTNAVVDVDYYDDEMILVN